jgi:D-alanyl-D-alanine carboxypeptidase
MILRVLVLACTALALLPGTAAAGRSSEPLQRTLADVFARTPLSPGMTAAVEQPGLRWKGAVGVIDRATGAPLRTRDSYRIASVGKTFTAVAVLRLVERGRVALDAPISRYLPRVYLEALQVDGDAAADHRADGVAAHHRHVGLRRVRAVHGGGVR